MRREASEDGESCRLVSRVCLAGVAQELPVSGRHLGLELPQLGDLTDQLVQGLLSQLAPSPASLEDAGGEAGPDAALKEERQHPARP